MKSDQPLVATKRVETGVETSFRPANFLRTVLVVSLLAIPLLEVLLWLVLPLADPHESARSFTPYIRREHQANEKRMFQAEPGLPGMEGISVWTTNNVGFRGDRLVVPKPANEFRILLIGGSTTECLIVDDEDSIEAVVQRTVQRHFRDSRVIKVYNAGVSGDRSDDHVAMLTQRIVHMEPDMVVVFAGINDLRAAIDGHDYLHFPTPAKPPWMLMATQTQLGRLAYYVAKWRVPSFATVDEQPVETAYRVGADLQKATALAWELPMTNVEAYANNLRTMAGVATAHAVDLIFMTQQTTWNSDLDSKAAEWHWLLRVGDVRYAESVMDEALEEMNDAMRQIAASMALPLYDLARQMPKSTDYFYDDVHFNTNGARIAGIELSQLIIRQIEVRESMVGN